MVRLMAVLKGRHAASLDMSKASGLVMARLAYGLPCRLRDGRGKDVCATKISFVPSEVEGSRHRAYAVPGSLPPLPERILPR